MLIANMLFTPILPVLSVHAEDAIVTEGSGFG